VRSDRRGYHAGFETGEVIVEEDGVAARAAGEQKECASYDKPD
jgi:hypothetical protein